MLSCPLGECQRGPPTVFKYSKTDLHKTVIQTHCLLGVFQCLSKAREHHEGGRPVPKITGIFGPCI